MFVGCFEISISVIVKHVQRVIITVLSVRVLSIRELSVYLEGLVKIFNAWGTEQIAGLWFAKVNWYPGYD